jgi:hypothetical protein
MGHRTGCGNIYNNTDRPFSVYDPQSNWGQTVNPYGGSESFKCGVALGWATNTDDVRNFAFRFQRVDPLMKTDEFYLFEDTVQGVCWTPMGNPSYDNRRSAGQRNVGCVNVSIVAYTDPNTNVTTYYPSAQKVY